MKTPLYTGLGIILSVMVFAASCFAEQIKFGNWVGIEETDPTTNVKKRQIGTFSGNRNNSLWLTASASGTDRIQLALKSDQMMSSNYFAYRIDRIDTLTLHSAIKGCNGNCLTDEVALSSELIKNMRRGLRIKFEYESVPDITQNPSFSLRGFSRAFTWLLAE
ncbi:MAG: hypothetical protein PVJ18_16800 [Desulfobacterales bacterium]|jgi:hypothetical protein